MTDKKYKTTDHTYSQYGETINQIEGDMYTAHLRGEAAISDMDWFLDHIAARLSPAPGPEVNRGVVRSALRLACGVSPEPSE